ncbi:AMP-binding enzyme [Colletotrichum sublineola]|nr:AMP-binding enzyme [Colletotrichum sublineola]
MAPHDQSHAIAIIGSACRFPGESVTPSKLWELLRDPRDVGGPLPASRFNAEGFHHPDPLHHGHSNVKDMRAYFLSGEGVEHRFDAGFFGIRSAEAAVLDPQVRLLMETTYEALEAAGQTMEALRGSDTGCYVGMMISEYEQSMMRDPESTGTYHILGTARSLMSNRLSYFFDWHGPSMTIDTACSSSLVAVHQAVQLLRSGESRVAIAAGSNMIMDPVTYVGESKLQMLSPDGRGRMWDADVNGYARGEGVATIVMKRLCDAVADGDDIECVIRETGVNQDGKTRGITMPSASAQSALIRDTYRRAGLDPHRPADRPQYFEAHGTGTPAGDPVEAEAIHSAFFGGRPTKSNEERGRDTLLVGSIKTVCGHAEGAAGIAGVLKASLALKHAAVPPNLLFERPNPRIEPLMANLRVPTSLEPWPPTEAGEPRRASVNNFGFGGTNAHAILESYATARPSSPQRYPDRPPVFSPFCFSAATETSLRRQLGNLADYLDTDEGRSVSLRDLAYTLHSRRSRLPFTTAVSASSVGELRSKLADKCRGADANATGIVRLRLDSDASTERRAPFILGVFTGQGAQWPAMGARLLAASPAAASRIASLEERLAQLPPADRPTWSLREELTRQDGSRVAEAELSQPLCTAVQILLVDMLRSLGIEFAAVVGHSSGEMGAAYAAGVLSAADAVCIAYYRGLHTRLACGPDNRKGSMLAVGVSSEDALELVDSDVFRGRASIAAYNSSKSLTLSGDEDAIADIQVILEDENKFARLLKVDKAYHSHHMAPFAGPYGRSLRDLNIRVSPPRCAWISSVTGSNIVDDGDHSLDSLRGPYWVQNAVGPVLFMQALQRACSSPGASEMQAVIEVGPHPALQTPATQTLEETLGRTVPYTGLLRRAHDDVVSVAQGLGHVWTHLGPLDLRAYEAFMSGGEPVRVVKGLPPYSWDHDARHWHRSRLADAVLNRGKPHPLLGHLMGESSRGHELRWRQFLSPAEMPWLNGHRLQNQSVFPAAGYIVLAIEAGRELVAMRPPGLGLGTERAGLIRVHKVDIQQAMAFDDDDSKVEAVFAINSIVNDASRHAITANFTYSGSSSGTTRSMGAESPLRLLASGHLEILLVPEEHSNGGGGAAPPPPPLTLPARGPLAVNTLPVREADFYSSLGQLEYEYSGPFRALSGLRRRLGFVRGWVATPPDKERTDLLIHPATLDAAFQAVLLARAMPYDGSLWSMHVPKTIESVLVDVGACEKVMPTSEKLPFDSHQPSGLRHIFKGDVDLYPPPSPLVDGDDDGDDAACAIIQVEGLHCVPFSAATAQHDKELLSVLVWDRAAPDANRLASADATSGKPAGSDGGKLQLAEFLERLSLFFLRRLQRSVPADHACRGDGHPLGPLFGFAQHVETLAATRWPFWKAEWSNDTREMLAAAAEPYVDVVDYQLLSRIGDSMVDIATGKTTAIEVSMRDKLLNEYYPNALGMAEATENLARTVKQMTHRHPHLSILEVGAGTGGATKAILKTVGDSFASYVFTDVSSGFFPTAQEYFQDHISPAAASRIKYKILDIGKDQVQQGFQSEGYDVVVASMVLHATPVLAQSLKNARKLLRPGGWLLLNEGVDNDVARCGAIFGTFPGWWLGAQSSGGDGRVLGPFVPLPEWDRLLRGAGFGGVDSVVPIAHPLLASNTVFVAQAVDPGVSFLRNPLSFSPADVAKLTAVAPALQDLVIVGGGRLGAADGSVCRSLKPLLERYFRRVVQVDSLEKAASLGTLSSATTTVLSLCDAEEPVMKSLDDATFEAIKTILNSARAILWITHGRRAEEPFASMTVGLVRSLLLEIPTLSFQFLDFEDTQAVTADALTEALLRFTASAAWNQQDKATKGAGSMLLTVERELVLDREGQLLIPRFVPDRDMNDRYNSARRPIGKTQRLKAESEATRVVSIRRDAQGKILCLEESAEPEAVNVTHSLLRACSVGGVGRAHVHLAWDSQNVPRVVLSDHLSSAVCPLDKSTVVPVRDQGGARLLRDPNSAGRFLWLVALNLVAFDVLRGLSRGEKLVAYEPEPALAAILQREAKDRGVLVDILTSETSRQRCELLGWSFIHPRAPLRAVERCVPSSVSAFLICHDAGHGVVGRIISRLPERCRVFDLAGMICDETTSVRPLGHGDVFFNGDGADANAETLGHRLRHAVLYALQDTPLSLSNTTTNIRLVPIAQIAKAALGDAGALLPKATELRVVVEWDGVDESPVNVTTIDQQLQLHQQPQEQHLFSDTKTYWLAGLTGGLGLSLCEWMVGQGARYFVITSRSPNVSTSWLSKMADRSVVVKIYSNDLTDLQQTEALLRDMHAVMPPLGGVAMGAMVLKDMAFDNMSLRDMRVVTDPKVRGSVHLESLLGNMDLDFFVLLSSLTAVTGNPGQSNYSAANLFMAGLAGARRRRGLAATVMHIAAVLGVGYVSEKTEASKTNFSRTSGYTLTSEQDFHQHFAEAVVAGRARDVSGRRCGPLEIAMGLQKESANADKKAFWFGNPTITHLIRNEDGNTGEDAGAAGTARGGSRDSRASVRALLASATSRAEAVRIVKDGFVPFVRSLFQFPGGDDQASVDELSRVKLDDMGLDSLLAVEIRTWWLKTINVNLPVMKILSGVSVDQLVDMGVDQLPRDLVPNVEQQRTPADPPSPDRSASLVDTVGSASEETEPEIQSDLGSSSDNTPSASLGDITTATTSRAVTPPAVDEDAPDGHGKLLEARPAVSRWLEPSFSQKMFWFVLSFVDHGAGLNHTGMFRLTGPVDVDKLERAVLQLGQRHDILRTCFENVDGRTKAGIMERSLLKLERRRIVEEHEAHDVARELHAYSYDVSAGECLRMVLLTLAPTTHFLLYGTHSLVLDGFSSAILNNELIRLYKDDGDMTPADAVYQYSSFAQSQIQAMHEGAWESDLAFWRKTFASCPSPLPLLSFSSVASRPEQGAYRNHQAKLQVESSTKSRIWDLYRHHRVRPFHFFLTVFRACLARFADANEVAIGIADANRVHDDAMESLGPYVNMIPLRFLSDPQLAFDEAVRDTKQTTDEALAHSAVPFQALLDDLGVPRSSTHPPIFQTFFDYRQGLPKRQQWGDCELEMLSFALPPVPYDVALDITDDGKDGGCHLMLIVRQDMYTERDAEIILGAYEKLLMAFVTNPGQVFSAPQIYETSEIELALGFGQGDFSPSEWTRTYGSVLGRIEALAEEHPHSLALKSPHGGPSMTYRDMIAKSRAIGAALVAVGCVPGASVVVYQDSTPDWICSVLGTFSINGVCVPCDAGTPVKRLADMVASSKATVLLVDASTAEQAAGALSTTISDRERVRILRVDRIEAATLGHASSTARGRPPPGPQDPAMMLYTSGSTGTPKGIRLKHEGFTNWAEFTVPRLLTDTCTGSGGGGDLVVLQQSSIGFDMAYLQAFLALAYGGALCIVPRAQRVDAGAITRIMAAEGVTVTCAVPSEYKNWLTYGDRALLAAGLSSWRTAVSGGEPGSDAVVELLAVRGPRQSKGQQLPRVMHIYGPTEITFFATFGALGPDDAKQLPAAAGRPLHNYSVYVLDESLRPVPPGVVGEIFVGGAGVAAGYVSGETETGTETESATADKFLPDHLAPAAFLSQGWTTMHRTGDNGHWRADGQLVIQGRRSGDTQHKIRGLRVDFQEVEKAILEESHGLLSEVVVTARRSTPQSAEFLVAHVKLNQDEAPADAHERQTLLGRLSSGLPLPQYMWPAIVVPVPDFPRTMSGKLDRRAVALFPLPEAASADDDGSDDNGERAAALSLTEARLQGVWYDVISTAVTSRRTVTSETDFFHVGGTSLLLLQLQARIHREFGLRVPLVNLFASSSLAAMAKLIDDAGSASPGRLSSSEPATTCTFDWDAETDMTETTLAALKMSVPHRPASPSAVVVVLTGATGLLGQAYLQALIADSGVHRVHCIGVRDAAARLSSLPLLRHGKVVVSEGDLGLARLGLGESRARTIFGEADLIIHNGADTSHLKTYSSLRRTNVGATREIVDMCLLVGKRIPIHYVSTASVLQYAGLDEFGEESAARYPPAPDAFDGYSASKWASERYLEKLNDRCAEERGGGGDGWPVWIHRLTSVQRGGSGDDNNSSHNKAPGQDASEEPTNMDIVWNLFKYCKLAKAVCVLPNWSGFLNMVPLEQAVKSMMRNMHAGIIEEQANREAGVRYRHVVGDVDVPLSGFRQSMEGILGEPVAELTLEEWVREAAGFGMNPVLSAFFGSLGELRPVTWPRVLGSRYQ